MKLSYCLIVTFLLLSGSAVAQITFVGVATTPTDNGSSAVNTSTAVAVTPPAAQVGDLIIMIGERRGTNATMSVSVTGGQTWNTIATFGNTNLRGGIFWCRYNGTWAANPSILFNSNTGTASSVQMLVFRPSKRTNTWAVDVTQVTNTFVAPTTPFSVSRTGVTPTNNSNVTLAIWMTTAANTWTVTGSTNWSQTGLGNQYRNSGGGAQSSSYAYQIQTVAGATGAVTKNENSSVAGATAILSFFEYQRGMPVFMF